MKSYAHMNDEKVGRGDQPVRPKKKRKPKEKQGGLLDALAGVPATAALLAFSSLALSPFMAAEPAGWSFGRLIHLTAGFFQEAFGWSTVPFIVACAYCAYLLFNAEKAAPYAKAASAVGFLAAFSIFTAVLGTGHGGVGGAFLLGLPAPVIGQGFLPAIISLAAAFFTRRG